MWIAQGEIPLESQLRLQHETEKSDHPLKAELPYGYVAVKKLTK